MKKLIFGLSKPKKWMPLSWLIMAITRAPYSHAYIKIWSDTYQRYIVYQASSTMVNFMNIETFENHNQVVHEFEICIPHDVMMKVMQFCIDNCGKPYGVKELLGLGYVQVMAMFKVAKTNPWRDSHTFVCSGLSAEILICLGIELPKDPNDMTPEDIYNVLVSNYFILAIS